MNKKILFLITDFNGGGAENVFVQLANYFSLKYEVHFMVLRAKGPNLLKLNKNIKLIELKKKNSISSVFKINKYIKNNNIDVAIGTLAMAYSISIANLFGSKNCKYIARVGSIVSANLSEKTLIKRLIMSFYQKVLYFSDIVLTQSIFMDNDLKNYLKRETHVIYNPISSNRILSLLKEKNSINLDKNNFNIISVGRLEKEKDYKTAILSISKLLDKIKNIKYYILGEGSLMNELKIYSNSLGLSDHVIFTGYLSNPYSFIKNSNILLLTSLYEGFSNVILESLFLKTPVVATNSPGGNNEILLNGKNGYLAEVGDPDDIVNKLIMVKNQKKFEFDVSKYEINFIGKEYEKYFY
jgi:glycosyltransferase involved in cell wall biosynthesis